MPKLLYYVSGHGYGHASRAAEAMRHFLAIRPDCEVLVRTVAPRLFFASLPHNRAVIDAAEVDPGVVEAGSLHIDQQQTVRAIERFLDRQEEIVASEVSLVRNHHIAAVAADVPFIAGDVAAALGVPCLAISNFTWDWIYEPYLDLKREGDRILESIRASYRKMELLLRLPFGHAIDARAFQTVQDVPLLARRGQHDMQKTLRHLAVAVTDSRPRVFLAIRGQLASEVIDTAAATSPDLLFLVPNASSELDRENIRRVTFSDIGFADVLDASDIVVSKLGYSILAECVASKKALLWPPRDGFREDEILCSAASRYLRSQRVTLSEFSAGRWSGSLDAILAQPQPEHSIAMNGGTVCASVLSKYVDGH